MITILPYQNYSDTTETCLWANVVEMNSANFEARRESCLLALLPKGIFVKNMIWVHLVAELHNRDMPSTGIVIMCGVCNVSF